MGEVRQIEQDIRQSLAGDTQAQVESNQRAQAEARLARRFLALMGIATLAFGLIVAGHYLLGWW